MISQLQESEVARIGLMESRRLIRPKTDQTEVEGKFLRRNGERFWIKGVTYGSFALNDEGEPFPPFPQAFNQPQITFRIIIEYAIGAAATR